MSPAWLRDFMQPQPVLIQMSLDSMPEWEMQDRELIIMMKDIGITEHIISSTLDRARNPPSNTTAQTSCSQRIFLVEGYSSSEVPITLRLTELPRSRSLISDPQGL